MALNTTNDASKSVAILNSDDDLSRYAETPKAELRKEDSMTIETLLKSIDGRFQTMDGRFQAMDVRFQAMDGRLDAMEKRFDVSMGMLLELQRSMVDLNVGVIELKVGARHLTTTAESIQGNVDILAKKVEVLVNWKNAVFGGVAVLAILWAIFKAFSDYVHIGPVVAPAHSAQTMTLPHRPLNAPAAP